LILVTRATVVFCLSSTVTDTRVTVAVSAVAVWSSRVGLVSSAVTSTRVAVAVGAVTVWSSSVGLIFSTTVVVVVLCVHNSHNSAVAVDAGAWVASAGWGSVLDDRGWEDSSESSGVENSLW